MSNSSWYRRSIWHFKGAREYTKAGYETASANFNEKDLDVDCSGKFYMITGANSGIGLATALEIAKRGGELHLVCRNAKSMKEARSHIITTTGNDRISQHQVNLSKPREVRSWAEEFLKNHTKLDVLINNAGCMINERIVDDDEIEANFAVNTLAVHIITTTLQPLIEQSNSGRVITVSSGGMLTVKLDTMDLNFTRMNPFIGAIAYCQTKRQQAVMNFCNAQRYGKIHFYCMHPGWVDTPGLQTSMPDFYKMNKDNLRTPLQGADTVVWLALSDAAYKHHSGLFFQDRVPTLTHLPMAWTKSTVDMEQQLMQKLDELVIKFSTIENYFTIGNIGSDMHNSDVFLGMQVYNKNLDGASGEVRDISTIQFEGNSDVVSKQTSLDHPGRISQSLSTSKSDDDDIINEVEKILHSNDHKFVHPKDEPSNTDVVIAAKNDSKCDDEPNKISNLEKNQKIKPKKENSAEEPLKTKTLIKGSTSEKRKEDAIDDLLNDAFQNVNLKEIE